jgi:hypothetical protein
MLHHAFRFSTCWNRQKVGDGLFITGYTVSEQQSSRHRYIVFETKLHTGFVAGGSTMARRFVSNLCGFK